MGQNPSKGGDHPTSQTPETPGLEASPQSAAEVCEYTSYSIPKSGAHVPIVVSPGHSSSKYVFCTNAIHNAHISGLATRK